MKHKPRKSKRRRIKVEKRPLSSRQDHKSTDADESANRTGDCVPVEQLVAALASSGLKSSSKRRPRGPRSGELISFATETFDESQGENVLEKQPIEDKPGENQLDQNSAGLVESAVVEAEDDLRHVEGEAAPHLVAIIEGLLFAAPKPLTVRDLHRILQETTIRQIQLAIKHLIEIRSDAGIVVARAGGGFVLTTHPKHAKWVQQLLQSKPARLSRAQLECLAIVSYRQPVTRPEIDHVRGVDSGASLKALLERDLIQIVGKKDEPGRPMLYGTTLHFLEFFNLMSLRDLPDLREFRELSDGPKEMLRNKLGPDEAEMLGQEVLQYSINAKTVASIETSTLEPPASEVNPITEEICDSY